MSKEYRSYQPSSNNVLFCVQYFNIIYGGQLIPYVQITLEKGPGPISSPRIRKYPRMTSKRRDERWTSKRSKEYL